MCECSICLNPVRYTRRSKQLDCGHLYHKECIDRWMEVGNTCPMCRSLVQEPAPKFKVTIRVENTATNNVTIDEIITEFLLESFQGEINFETNTSEELYHIIHSLGILRSVDIDSLVLNTERAAVP